MRKVAQTNKPENERTALGNRRIDDGRHNAHLQVQTMLPTKGLSVTTVLVCVGTLSTTLPKMSVLSKMQKKRRGISAEVPRGRHHRVDGAEQRLGALTWRRDQSLAVTEINFLKFAPYSIPAEPRRSLRAVRHCRLRRALRFVNQAVRDRTNGIFDKEVSSKKRVFVSRHPEALAVDYSDFAGLSRLPAPQRRKTTRHWTS